jgi:hypothetical protein
LSLHDLRRFETGPISRMPKDWEALVYGRLLALPDAATPLQRAQLLAELSAGPEIIQLCYMVCRLDRSIELHGPLEVLAQGNRRVAIASLDLRSRFKPGPRDKQLSGHAVAYLHCPRRSHNMLRISTKERAREVQPTSTCSASMLGRSR